MSELPPDVLSFSQSVLGLFATLNLFDHVFKCAPKFNMSNDCLTLKRSIVISIKCGTIYSRFIIFKVNTQEGLHQIVEHMIPFNYSETVWCVK